MFCLRLCPLLLIRNIDIFCLSLSLIHFDKKQEQKWWKSRFEGNGVNTRNNMCFSCFKTSVEKIYRNSRQTQKISCWKKYKEHTRLSRFVRAPNMGENFIGTAWGHVYQKRTQKLPKMGPKRTWRDIAMTPEIFWNKKSEFRPCFDADTQWGQPYW
jgi:hypothetical protein